MKIEINLKVHFDRLEQEKFEIKLYIYEDHSGDQTSAEELSTQIKSILIKAGLSVTDILLLEFSSINGNDSVEYHSAAMEGVGESSLIAQGHFSTTVKRAWRQVEKFKETLLKQEAIKYKEYLVNNNLVNYCLINNITEFKAVSYREFLYNVTLTYVFDQKNYVIYEMEDGQQTKEKNIPSLKFEKCLNILGEQNFVSLLGCNKYLSQEFKSVAGEFIQEFFFDKKNTLGIKLLEISETKKEINKKNSKEVSFFFLSSDEFDKLDTKSDEIKDESKIDVESEETAKGCCIVS